MDRRERRVFTRALESEYDSGVRSLRFLLESESESGVDFFIQLRTPEEILKKI